MLNFNEKIKLPVDEAPNCIPFTFSLSHRDNREPIPFWGWMEICSNPFCPCRDVVFSITETRAADIVADGYWLYTFYIDLFKKEYKGLKKKIFPGLPSKNSKFAKNFLASLSDDDWRQLIEKFFIFKNSLVESFDPSQTIDKLHLPKKLIEEGTMVGYYEIFPFAKNDFFPRGEHKFLVDEMYCLNPECSCKEVMIAFILLNEDNPKSLHYRASIWYDYQHHTWKPDELFPDDTFDLSDFTSRYFNSRPDIDIVCRKRHELMKAVYRKTRRPVPESPRLDKPGRNEPCPCGSGKKYKKCCGR